MNKLEKLVNDGYEDLTISKQNLIKLIEKHSHNIPLLINNRKVWIHFTESDKIFVECDISDGSGVELTIEEIEKVMTPREKASELVDKFSNKCLLTTDGGKVAALIAVDEIIKECYNWNGSDNVQWETKRFDYWNEVKQEIEKL